MPRMLVDRPLKWDDKLYQPGVQVDIPDSVINSLPEGTVKPVPEPEHYPVAEPPTPRDQQQPIKSGGPVRMAETKPAEATAKK